MMKPKKVQSIASLLCANLYNTSSLTKRISDDQHILDFYEFLLQSSHAKKLTGLTSKLFTGQFQSETISTTCQCR